MRIVSLVPSLTNALAQLGVGDQIVGVTDYCLYPAGVVARAQRIGGTKNPNLDSVQALSPDLVVANTDEQRAETLAELDSTDLNVLVTSTDSLDDVAHTWTQLGNATGQHEAAAACRASLEAAVAAARRATQGLERLTTLVPVWRDPWMAAGGDTYLGDLLAACGFDNILAGTPERWARFEPTTDGTVAARKQTTKGPRAGHAVHALPGVPAAVLLPTEPYAFSDADRDSFQELGVPRSRVRVVDGELLTWWLSHTVPALSTFTQLHSELAGDQ